MKKIHRIIVLAILLAAPKVSAQLPSDPDAISEEERQALLQLFETTSGHQWIDRTGWGGPVGTECDWFGVGCGYSAEGKMTVKALFLADNGLAGTLPDTLGNLSNLSELLLSRNKLTGTVPKSLLQRFDEGLVRFLGYAEQFSPIVAVHLDVRPTG